jgi:hypothetical protein
MDPLLLQKIHVKPRVSGTRPAETLQPEAKDTDVEGAPTELTIADLMKHARHDGKGMFIKHMRALLIKRWHYFKRDLKGLLFLVLIPIAVVFAIVALLQVPRGA